MKKREWKRRAKAAEAAVSLLADELRQWRSGERLVVPEPVPEPEERVCSGIAWTARWDRTIWSGSVRWYARYWNADTPCATMTGCVGRPWARRCLASFSAPSHTHPCGVMS